MKPSSPDPQTPPTAGTLTSVRLPDAVVPDDASVRPARLDRPLGRNLMQPGYADSALEDVLAASAAKAHDAARAHGYAAGWSQGSHAASARAVEQERLRQAQLQEERRAVAARGQQLLASLADTVRRRQQATLPDWHDVADALTDGALALAAAAIGRELASVDAPVVEAVRVAVRALGDPDRVAVHLHPEDAALLGLADLPAGVRLVPDATVPAGTVQAQTPAQRLVFDLPAAIRAAEEVLRS